MKQHYISYIPVSHASTQLDKVYTSAAQKKKYFTFIFEIFAS